MTDWLRPNHRVFWVSEVVEQLDMSEILQEYTKSSKGQPPYSPLMMVRLLVYAYGTGV